MRTAAADPARVEHAYAATGFDPGSDQSPYEHNADPQLSFRAGAAGVSAVSAGTSGSPATGSAIATGSSPTVVAPKRRSKVRWMASPLASPENP